MYHIIKLGETHVMQDFETMSLADNAAIVAIGATAFDYKGLTDSFYRTIRLDTCQSLGMNIDPSTVLWWLEQSRSAQAEITSARTDIKSALHDYVQWLTRHKPVGLWANGSMADNVWLRSALRSADLALPWEKAYRVYRCYKTIRDSFPIISPPEFVGTQHNALADAEHQARHLLAINSYLAASIRLAARDKGSDDA